MQVTNNSTTCGCKQMCISTCSKSAQKILYRLKRSSLLAQKLIEGRVKFFIILKQLQSTIQMHETPAKLHDQDGKKTQPKTRLYGKSENKYNNKIPQIQGTHAQELPKSLKANNNVSERETRFPGKNLKCKNKKHQAHQWRNATMYSSKSLYAKRKSSAT